MKKKIVCAVLCALLSFSNMNYVSAAAATSIAYESSLIDVYINELKISVPEE